MPRFTCDTGMQEGKLVAAAGEGPLRVADMDIAGMHYLWALALDSPNAIASTVRPCLANFDCLRLAVRGRPK